MHVIPDIVQRSAELWPRGIHPALVVGVVEVLDLLGNPSRELLPRHKDPERIVRAFVFDDLDLGELRQRLQTLTISTSNDEHVRVISMLNRTDEPSLAKNPNSNHSFICGPRPFILSFSDIALIVLLLLFHPSYTLMRDCTFCT